MLDIEARRVENPHTTYAQFVADLEAGKHDAGVQLAPVNMTTLVGGAHRFFGPPGSQGREMRLEACRVFRSTYEASQVGGAKAVDPSNEPVDGGWLNPHAAFERGVDARRKWDGITDAMTRMEMNRLHFVIIGEWGPTSYARHTLGIRKADSKHIAAAKTEFRWIVDKLARALDLAT